MADFYKDNFDSDIMHRNVFKLYLKGDSGGEKKIASLLKRHSVDSVFCFSDFLAKNIFALENLKFNFLSIRNTYKLAGSGYTARSTQKLDDRFKVLQYSKDKPKISKPDILRFARIIGATSRYFHDSAIPKIYAERLYVRWIENSLKGYADECFMVMRGGRLAGLITLKIKEAAGYIDLIGVGENYQGIGLGGVLASRSIEYFKSKNIKNIFVVTEGENLQANIFYQKNGFITQNVELVYHKHF